MKCHKCGKLGHDQKNCKAGEEKMSSKCRFCGGSRKCKMKKCRAYNSKCNTCNQFGHYSSCCSGQTDCTCCTYCCRPCISSSCIFLNHRRTCTWRTSSPLLPYSSFGRGPTCHICDTSFWLWMRQTRYQRQLDGR